MSTSIVDRIMVVIEAQMDALTKGGPNAARVFERSMTDVERSAAKMEATVRTTASRSAAAIEAGSARTSAAQSIVKDAIAGAANAMVETGPASQIMSTALGAVTTATATAGAEAGVMASVLAGPWGLAIEAGVAVLALLATNLFTSADASEAATAATKELEDAERRLANASAAANHQTEIGIGLDIDKARSALQRAMATRRAKIAELELAKGREEEEQYYDRTDLSGSRVPGIGPAKARDDAADIQREIDKQNAEIVKEGALVLAGRSQLIMRNIAGATDAATKATHQYENAIDALERKFQAGKLSPADFERQALAITKAKDAALAAARVRPSGAGGNGSGRSSSGSAASTRREEAAAAREAAEAQRELDQALDRLFDRYGPMSDAAKTYARALDDIATASRALSAEQQNMLKNKALSEYLETSNKPLFADIERRSTPDLNALIKSLPGIPLISDQAQRDAEDKIRNLSGLYFDLFSQGTKGVWSDFKRIGLSIISETLARFTIGQLFGGSNKMSLGSTFTKVAGSLLHFDNGGSVTLGGEPGKDRNLLSLNGAPIAMVGRGETLNVGSTHASARDGQTIVQQTFVLDARGGVVTQDLIDYVNRTAQQAAVEGAKGGHALAMRDVAGLARRKL